MTDWSDVHFFLELSRAGTLAGAARKLGVDDTTVGRRLAALERNLGAKLVTRTPDGLVLTPAGDAMRGAGEAMEAALSRAEQESQGSDRRLAGLVRVATTETLGELVVLPAVRALHDRHPTIRVDLIAGVTRLDIARREADLALRYVRPTSGDLVARRVGAVAFGAYASKAYLDARGRPERGGGFVGHDLIGYEGPVRSWRGNQMGGEPVRDGRYLLRTNGTTMIIAAIRLGLGIGVLPCALARPHREMERVPTGAPIEVDDLFLVVHKDVQRTGRVRAVIDALEARLAAVAHELSSAA